MLVPEKVPLKVIDPVIPNFDPSKVRFDSTIAFGEETSSVIIPLLVFPVSESIPDVPDVPLVPSTPEVPLVPEVPDVPLDPAPPPPAARLVDTPVPSVVISQ